MVKSNVTKMKKTFPYVFNKHELISEFKSEKQLDNWLANKVRSKKIKKVRNGLYARVDETGYAYSSKFEIASKISNDSYPAYHSAIEYHGIANQVFNSLIVCSSSRFRDFEFEGIDYISEVNKNRVGVIDVATSGVRVTTLERTIIDCIDDIDLAGGIEELLNALSQIRFVDEEKLLTALSSYDKVILYQKAGYMLEQFKEELHLSDHFFQICESKLTKQVKYFLKSDYKDIEYNAKWKLMAPHNLKRLIEGGEYQ